MNIKLNKRKCYLSLMITTLLFCSNVFADKQNEQEKMLECFLNATDPSACQLSNFNSENLPVLPKNNLEEATFVDKIKHLTKYKYDTGYGLTIGSQPYVKNFGDRGRTLGIGAQFDSSSLSVTVKDPSIHWMKEINDSSNFNFRVGAGGKYGDKAQVIFGYDRRW